MFLPRLAIAAFSCVFTLSACATSVAPDAATAI